MAETFKLISTISYVIAILFLCLSVVLFIKFNIKKIVGDLSGRNARKAIGAMKTAKVSKENKSADILYKRPIKEVSKSFITEKITQQISVGNVENIEATAVLQEGVDNSTMVLEADNNATSVLGTGDNVTTVLEPQVVGTTVLSEPTFGTTVLSQEEVHNDEEKFVVEKEFLFIHGKTCLY